jgi:peptide deformylase
MAIREVRKEGDEVLRKVSKEVGAINGRILTLIKDMAETMYKSEGVGLAAPQVGILKRIVVIDVGNGLIELINPKIVSESGEQTDMEGCLSVPEKFGEVKRPLKVSVEALNSEGKNIVVEGEDLLAVALCHEIEHLDVILFTDKAIKLIDKSELERGK